MYQKIKQINNLLGKLFLNRLTILLIFIGMQPKSVNAQLFTNYSANRSTGVSYSSISTSGNSVGSWRYSGGFSQDDNRSYFINIGFDFWYAGVRYTSLSVSTNGFLDFSTSTDDGGPNADDFGYSNLAFTEPNAANATRPAIAPMYDDMTAQGGVDPLGSSIKYQTTGTAPNRIFTMEWINMAVYGNTSPSLNFQAMIYESTGVIDFNYGTMTNGTHTFSYTCGLNGTTMNNNPTNAQLKAQQTANTATFSSGEVNNLVTIPASNSQIKFTPPVPANPTGSLSFTTITNSGMTLNWSNWATNEVGYVIYNSIDGSNYYYVTQTAANATSAVISNLSPSTLYYWKVYAVTEGCLSNELTGSATTLASGIKLSNVTNGDWNTAGSWLPSGVPGPSDDVIIRNGNTIRIDGNASCNNLTVGQSGGTLTIGNNGISRAITVNGNISVTSTGSFYVNSSSNTTHTMTLKGKLQNDGILNFRTDANSLCDVTFNRNNSQSISGSGGINSFNRITVSIGSSGTDSLYVDATVFTAPGDFLTLNTGCFKLGSTSATTFVFTTPYTISQYGGLILENTNSTFDFQGGLTLEGLLKINSGNVLVGNAAGENLSSRGGTLKMNGGTLAIAGNYAVPDINNLALFTITNGTMTVATTGSTSTTLAPFQIYGAGSVFNMSGGSIIIQREGGTGAQNLGYVVTGTSSSNVTGGTLQIGNASTPASQIMQINTTAPIGNLLINSTNAAAQLLGNSLSVINDISITAGSFNANALNVSLGGDWSDNGTWTPSIGTVTFYGSLDHTIDKLNGTTENFNHITTTGSGTLTLNDTITLTGNLTIGTGTGLNVGTNNNNINVAGNFTNNGTYDGQNGKVTFNGTALQSINASSLTSFYDLKIKNTAGAIISAGNYEINNTLYLTNGNFNVGAANSITLKSDATSTSRIAPVISGSLTGNFTVERFISGRAAGYSDMATPVVSTTMADWDDELLLAYTYSPPTAYSSAWTYDEVLYDYVPVTNSGTALTPGMGVEIWLDADGTYTSFDPTVLTSYGQPFTGSLNVSSSITNTNDGWNLIGNPYHSFISWDNLYATSSGIGSTIMIYDESIMDFQTYTTGSGVEIAPHQGFWVEVTGADNLTFTESVKTTSNSSNYRMEENDFTIAIEKNNSLLPLKSHTIFRFNIDSDKKADEYDVTFKGVAHPLSPNLFSVADTKKLRVNSSPYYDSTLIIPIHLDVAETGTYSLSFLNKESIDFTGYQCKKIYDRLQQVTIDINEIENYHFEVFDLDYHDRFLLLLSKNAECKIPVTQQIPVTFIPNNGGFTIKVSEAVIGNSNFSLLNMLGQIVTTDVIESGGEMFINLPLVSGVYHLLVENANGIYSYKSFAP